MPTKLDLVALQDRLAASFYRTNTMSAAQAEEIAGLAVMHVRRWLMEQNEAIFPADIMDANRAYLEAESLKRQNREAAREGITPAELSTILNTMMSNGFAVAVIDHSREN